MAVDRTDDESNKSTVWYLVAQEPGNPELGLPHQLRVVRDLKPGEYEAVISANECLAGFGASWSWNKIHSTVLEFYRYLANATSATLATKAISRVDVEQVDRTFWTLVHQVEDWLNQLAELALSEGSEAGRLAGVDAAIKALRRDGPISRCRLLAKSGASGFVRLIFGSGIPPTVHALLTATALQTIGAPADANVRVDVLVAAMMEELEVVAAQFVACHETDLTEAASRITAINGEVVFGTPALVPANDISQLVEGIGRGEKASFQLTQVLVQDVSRAMHGLRVAKHVIAQRHVPRPKGQGSEVKSGDTDSIGVGGRVASSEPELSTPSAPKPVSSPSDRSSGIPAADLRSLVHQAAQLPTAVEQAWSSALRDTEKWSGQLLAQWASVVRSLQDYVTTRNEELVRTGLHTMIPAFPLNDESAKTLELDATGQRRATQVALAELYAIHDLLDAMKALSNPSAVQLDLSTGRSRSWWEAGAFSLVADRGRAALRIFEESQAGPYSQQSDPRNVSWIEDASSAASCLTRGHHEAALFYACRAVKKRQGKDRPDNGASDQDTLVVKLFAAGERLTNGEELSAAALVPLVHYWVARLGKMINEQIDAIRLPNPAAAPDAPLGQPRSVSE